MPTSKGTPRPWTVEGQRLAGPNGAHYAYALPGHATGWALQEVADRLNAHDRLRRIQKAAEKLVGELRKHSEFGYIPHIEEAIEGVAKEVRGEA